MKRSFIFPAFALLATCFLTSSAWAQSLVQEFFVPLPEAQIRQHFQTIGSNIGSEFESIVSITVGNNNTRVVYDHWEDGYEVDLNNPVQSTTEIWGDGNDANGKPPGFAHDPMGLPSGTVIALRNKVTLPRNASQIRYDGRDRIGSSNAIVVSRAAWATSPGSVLADSVEVISTVDWGTNFIMPVGENVIFPTPASASMFEKVAMMVQAAENGTQVQVDKDGNGTVDATFTLNRGEVHFIQDGILRGATVTSSKPVQVTILGGDVGANYESRWYNIPPTTKWGSEYYSPVGTSSNGNEAYAFLYNPQAAPLTVNYVTKFTSGSFVIPAKDTYRFELPRDSATKFVSDADKTFYGIVTAGAKPSANQNFDWGFSLASVKNLTTAFVVGWGPGSADGSKNGNPVWVTAVQPTRIYVDYKGDRAGSLTDPAGQKYDVHYDIQAYDVLRIFDPSKDQTAMRVYTLDGTLIVGAWGEDPATAEPGNPFLDMGTTIPAFPAPVMFKTAEIFEDNGIPGPSVGDIVKYTVRLDNKSLVAISAVALIDVLPAGVSYIANSTQHDGGPVPDSGVTPFPLDEDGLTVPLIRSKDHTEVTYKIRIDEPGKFTNMVEAVGYPGTVATSTIEVSENGGGTSCGILFTGSTGVPKVFNPGDDLYVTITDPDTIVAGINVAVVNSTNGDTEIITLNSKGSGVYRNNTALHTSSSTGGGYNDGTLNVHPGDILTVQHTDPIFGDSCSNTTTIVQPSEIKQLYLTQDAADNDLTGNLDRIDPVASNDNTLSQSALVSSEWQNIVAAPASAVQAGASNNSSISGSFAVTNGSGTNRLMLVGIAYQDRPTRNMSVSTVTWGTNVLTRAAQESNSNAKTEIWYLTNPPIGTNSVTVSGSNVTGGDSMAFGAKVFSGVNLAQPFSATNTATGSGTNAALSVSAQSHEYVFSTLAVDQGRALTTTPTNNLWNTNTVNTNSTNGVRATAASSLGSDGSFAWGWATNQTRAWAAAGLAIQPAADFGSATYSQTPNFVSPFSMPSGGAVTAKSWVEVPSGHLPANPAISASLSYGGSNNFITLTNPTATLVSGGAQAITNSALSTTFSTSATKVTNSYTVPTGNNRLLMVAVAVGATTSTGNPGTISSATFRGTAMTLVKSNHSGSEGASYAGNDTISYIYSVTAPTTGTGDIVITTSAASSISVSAMTFFNVNQTTPLGTAEAVGGEGGDPSNISVTVSSAPGEVVFGTASADEGATLAPGSGVTGLWSSKFASFTTGAVGLADGAPSVNFNYTRSGTTEDWSIVAVPIKPILNSGIYRLDWASTMPSNVTVPTGQAVKLDVVNNIVGNPFKVLYDSKTYPSQVSLPTTTVIHAVSMDVYDAPYPAGNIMGSPISGQTGYVRVAVTDPFGTYDITSLNLVIDGPGTAGDVSATLNNSYVVHDDGTTKIYQFPWTTTANLGNYVLTATAKEGLENTITSSTTTSVTVTQGDLGTPSTTVFSKDVYSPNEDVCITTTDLDQNKDPNVAETVTVVVTSGAGDSESVVLTETGPDTGIFTACIPSSSTVPGGPNDGTIYAPPGTPLEVKYVDPDDPTDTSGDNATVPAAAAAVKVVKTRLTPTDGQAIVGESVSFRLRVSNTGPTTLNSVAVSDTFPAANLAFVSASIAPDATGSGSLTWNNVGPLTAGQTKDIIVEFTALASANPATNNVSVTASGGLTSNSSAIVKITNPSLVVTKTLVSPASGPAAIGDEVTFNITVQNTGDTAITELPLEDTFSGAQFEFVSTTPADNGHGYGSIFWENLASGGALLPGHSTSVSVTLRAMGKANPAINNASVLYASDENGDPVPPSQDDASIVTSAATISGTVFNDLDDDSAFSAGDGRLGGVTVRLYTDPNGDGNPADGTLVGFTVTAADGSYSFLDLPLGNYVVVQEDLVGFESVSDTAGNPTDNRVPVAVTALTDYTGNNFLDREQNTGTYGSISGQVRHDANADGDLSDLTDVGIPNVDMYLYTDPNGDGDPSDGVMFAFTKTKADGTYKFGSVPPGNYVVVENDPVGYVSTADVSNPNDNRVPVVVAPSSTNTGKDFLDATAGGSLATIGDRIWLDTNNNGILDADETGVDNVTVWIYRSNQTPGVDAPYGVTKTKDGGHYEFANLPVGSYTIMIPASNFAPGAPLANAPRVSSVSNATDDAVDNDNNGIQTGGVGTVVVSPLFALGNAEVDNTKDFGFVPNASLGSISGSVLNDSNHDGSGDAPIAGVTVTLKDSLGNVVSTTITGADGSYTFTSVPPGNYTIVETQPAGFVSSSDTDGGDLDIIGDVTPVVVAPGQAVTNQNFVEVQFGTISGSVLADTTGDGSGDAPLAGVTVTLKDSNGNDVDSDPTTPGVQPTTAVTAADGSYAFTNVIPGDYRVVQSVPTGYLAIHDVDGGDFTVIGNTTPISVSGGQTVSGRDFTDSQFGTISGKVWIDTDADNDGDAPIGGVEIALVDEHGNPVRDGNNDPITTVTNPDGSYTFTNVPPGTYGIEKTNPTGFSSVKDSDGGDPDKIGTVTVLPGQTNANNEFVIRELPVTVGGHVMIDTDLNGSPDAPLANAKLTLVDASGNPVLDENNLPITTTSAPDGSYSFSGLPAGTYGVRMDKATGYLGVSDVDGGAYDWVGDQTVIVLTAGQSSPNNDFLVRTQACPDTWQSWLDKWSQPNDPYANPDEDIFVNLLEYAFCLNPNSGGGLSGGTAYCMTPNIESVDKVDLTFRRTAGGATDVIYELEYAPTLGAEGTTWTTVAIPPANMVVTKRTDGTDSVRVVDLESITGLTSGTGFVRLKVSLDADKNGTPEASASTDVGGWIETPLDYAIRSFNDPFLQCPIFTGVISSVEDRDIIADVSGGGFNFDAKIKEHPAYAEIVTGPYEGHRFDLVGGGVNRFTTAVTTMEHIVSTGAGLPPYNTIEPLPSGLAGAKFVVRQHRDVENVFPPRAFIATDDPETASKIQMFAGDGWKTYWLFNNVDQASGQAEPMWLDFNSRNGLQDVSGVVMPPGQGGFVHTRQANVPGAKFIISGKVRGNAFIRPLSAGLNNVGGGYPLIQSPFGRAMTRDDNGFTGSPDFKKADQFMIWRGDTHNDLTETGYNTFFMIAGKPGKPVLASDWIYTSDATLKKQNNVLHFKPDYSTILFRNVAGPANRMPCPWKP